MSLNRELEVLDFWDKEDVFQKSVAQNKNNEPFVFFDGPPFATGTPHWGHIFISQVKDTVLRYQTQKGKYVPRRWGWDCHGVPIESHIEKEFGLVDKREIEEKIGIGEFNKACRATVLKYDDIWRSTIKRIGRWVDMDDQYRTMDNDFAESVWWGLSKLWENNLIFKGYRVSLYSPSLGIPLSHTDVAMEVKYQNETIESPVVRFEVIEESWGTLKSTILDSVTEQEKELQEKKDEVLKEISHTKKKSKGFSFLQNNKQTIEELPGEIKETVEANETEERKEVIDINIKLLSKIRETLNLPDKLSILAWTTTPWTLAGNSALAVGPEITYSIFFLPLTSEFVLVAENRAIPILSLQLTEDIHNTPEIKEQLEAGIDSYDYFQKLGIDIIKIVSLEGKDLVGLEYITPFENAIRIKEYEKKAGLWKVYSDEFVTDSDGTGIVHIAPYGEVDYELIKKYNLPLLLVLNEFGEVLNTVSEKLSPVWNKTIGAANPLINKILEKEGFLFGIIHHEHQVPYFDRNGKAVYYAPQEGWYIAEPKIQDKSLELNDTINWFPEHLKYGRFGKGLETAPDWNISRNRYWGNPLPIWQNKDKTQSIFIDSIENLVTKSINPFYRIINNKDLMPEFYAKTKTVIFGDSQAKLPLGINAAQYRSKNLYEMRQQKEYSIQKFAHFAQKILEEVLELFLKYDAVQVMFTEQEQVLWTTWLENLHPGSKKISKTFYFFKKVEWDIDSYEPVGRIIPFDIHRPMIDEVILKDDINQYYTRVEDVLDCWVESGSMPWASLHYPMERKDFFEKNQSADWVMEAQDQTRGWFRVLHVLSSGIFEKVAFKNVSVIGHILASDGAKMSKSKKNFADPDVILEKFGSDATRLYLTASALLNAESMSFREDDLSQYFRNSTLLIGNILKYYEYISSSVDTSSKQVSPKGYHHVLNTWWMAYTKQTMQQIMDHMESYSLHEAARLIPEYLDTLSVWYIRRSKDLVKEYGYEVLHCLTTTLKLFAVTCASLQPFNTEKIWSYLKDKQDPVSVHLTHFETIKELTLAEKLALSDMVNIRTMVSEIHNFRKEANHRVRQPLYADSSDSELTQELKDIIYLECNLLEKDLTRTEGELWKGTTKNGVLVVDKIVDDTLMQLGLARDFERFIQEFRKKKGLKANQMISLQLKNYESNDTSLVQEVIKQVNMEKLRTKITFVEELETTDSIDVKQLGVFDILIS
jgi:isoleucyl-tRNA synthetase